METCSWSLWLFLICAMNLHNCLSHQGFSFNFSACFDNSGSYSKNSLYETNLVSLLSSAPKINDTGFYTESIGSFPDYITVAMWCSVDIQLSDCRNCIAIASSYIQTSCPFSMKAVYYYLDCTLSYTNGELGEIPDFQSTWSFLSSGNQFSDVSQATTIREELYNSLQDRASGESILKVAIGNDTITGTFMTIFAMLQCMPHLSSMDCDRCLTLAVQQVFLHNNDSTIHGIVCPKCRVESSTNQFFNSSRIDEVRTMILAPQTLSRPHKSSFQARAVIIIIASVGAVFFVGGATIFGIKWMKRNKHADAPKEVDENIPDQFLQYDFDVIRLATNDFSQDNVLGRGGFGTVYKGTLVNGERIAVKRLASESSQGFAEFKNEVIVLANLRHKHLVKLQGFSLDGNEKLLIYEFLQNGSLNNFISDSTKRLSMDWNIRHKIIEGIAKGLAYLHADCGFRIIHRDLKLSNILSDDKMIAKISDFGLARLFNIEETSIKKISIAGTPGYMAPEYNSRGEVSTKTDVFSFGVLVLEIIAGQKRSSFIIDNSDEDLLIFAWECWREGKSDSLIDSILRSNSESLQDILRCIHIGLLCVQVNARDRPLMPSILEMLKSSSMVMCDPLRPELSPSNSSGVEQVMVNNSENEISSSDIYPR